MHFLNTISFFNCFFKRAGSPSFSLASLSFLSRTMYPTAGSTHPPLTQPKLSQRPYIQCHIFSPTIFPSHANLVAPRPVLSHPIPYIQLNHTKDKKDTYPAVSTHSSSSIFVHGPTAISLHPDTNVYPPARDTQRRWQLAHLLLLDILPPALRSEYCTVVLLSVVVESFRAR